MNTINLEHLKIFCFVAKLGSLTKAQKLLNIPKSKISKDLSKLEDYLDTQLLTRSPRGVILTEIGTILFKESKILIENLIETPQLIKETSNQLTGRIRITAPGDMAEDFLIDIFSNFQLLHPKVVIELYTSTEIVDFHDSDVDIALRIGRLPDSSLIQKKICDIQLNYFASQKYIKENKKIKNIGDLSLHEIATVKTLQGILVKKPSFDENAITFYSNSVTCLKKLAIKGNHIATLPHHICIDEIKSSKLQNILPEHSFFDAPLFLLSRATKHTPKHINEFKKFIHEEVSSFLKR